MGESAVHAVLVAFQADPQTVCRNLAPIRAALAGVVVVDNSNAADAARWHALVDQAPAARIISNGRNLGIAAALNQGMAAAFSGGADFALLLDDDSVPQPGMVDALVECWRGLRAQGISVAALGADYRDRSTGRHGEFPEWSGWRLQRHCCGSSGPAVLAADTLMSSGSLIHRDVYSAVGAMDESLFIDFVDKEWCWRARTAGYRCYGVCAAQLDHAFGEAPPVARGVPWLVRRPAARLYYRLRNLLLLWRRPYLPLCWKLHELARALLLAGASLSGSTPLHHLAMGLRGLRDGILGRSGPLLDA